MNELQSREMRVFLSSTFRDMEAERAHLVKNVFPRVRTACRSRQVGFTEIDLRWGVTEEEANNGATVEICLREIDNCRNFPPFFIGFLGERYGWIPQEKELRSYWDHNVLSPYAQVIKDAVSRGISVTELEMELAVFGNESTPPAYTPTQVREDRALFLFRDKTLSEHFFAQAATRSPGVVHIPDFFDSGGGKLELLKNKIRRSGLLKGENYTSLEMFGQIIEEHLIGALDRYFPTGEVPSEEEFIESAHRVFRRHRLVDFVPRPDLRAAIVDGISKRVDFPNLGPLLVTGRPGHGKSACMADVAQAVETGEIAACHRWKIIDHYVGADGSDTLDAWIYSTLCRWKILIGDESLILPETPKGRQEAFIPWAARAACSSGSGGTPDAPVKFVLLVDGLDQLRDRGRDLAPLMPEAVGEMCVVIATASETGTDSMEKLDKISLPPITCELRTNIIQKMLGRFRKRLPLSDLDELSAAPQCQSPLFLNLALEKLRRDAHHETLSLLIGRILQSQDAEALFLDAFLLDQDYSRQDQPDLAVRFMALLGASYFGLTEQDLSDLLARPDDPLAEDTGKPRLPRSFLSQLLNNFGGFLFNRGERRLPMHRMFAEAALNYLGERASTLLVSMEKEFFELSIDKFFKGKASLIDSFNSLEVLRNRVSASPRRHLADAVFVRPAGGAEDDYPEEWVFPCCGKRVITGDGKPDPNRTDGCH